MTWAQRFLVFLLLLCGVNLALCVVSLREGQLLIALLCLVGATGAQYWARAVWERIRQ